MANMQISSCLNFTNYASEPFAKSFSSQYKTSWILSHIIHINLPYKFIFALVKFLVRRRISG